MSWLELLVYYCEGVDDQHFVWHLALGTLYGI